MRVGEGKTEISSNMRFIFALACSYLTLKQYLIPNCKERKRQKPTLPFLAILAM